MKILSYSILWYCILGHENTTITESVQDSQDRVFRPKYNKIFKCVIYFNLILNSFEFLVENTPVLGENFEIDEEFQSEYEKIRSTKYQSFLEAELTFIGTLIALPYGGIHVVNFTHGLFHVNFYFIFDEHLQFKI